MNAEHRIKKRWALCAGLLGLSLLLLGAGKMNGEIKDHKAAAAEMKGACLQSVQELSAGIPRESRASWEELSSSDPALFIKASHGELRKTQSRQGAPN